MAEKELEYIVWALGSGFVFPTVRTMNDFARQMRNRGHAVERWVRYGAVGARFKDFSRG